MISYKKWNLATVIPETITSVRKFGIIRTLQVIKSRIEDLHFDLRNGTDTVQPVAIEEAGITSANISLGQRYQPSGATAIIRILSEIDISSNDGFIDYGCGKGRTLLLATHFPFRTIVGVEFSPMLAEIAIDNIRKYSARFPGRVEPNIYQSDASHFDLCDEATVIYFFHPFDEVIMSSVLNRIHESLKRCPRRLHILYYLPVHRSVFDSSNLLKLEKELIVNGYECCIYTSIK